MIRRVTVRGLIVKDNKLFCVRHRHRDGTESNYWCAPGGGLDVGESVENGIKREIIEETGITPDVGKLAVIAQFIDRKGRERLEIFFHIKNADDFLNINLNNTTHGKREIAEYGFFDPKTTNILIKGLRELDLKSIENLDGPIIFNEL